MSPRRDALTRGTRDHYQDAALYDYEYRRRRADVRFYRELARRFGGPVLELGCGTGRVALPIARAGHQVIGVDLNQPMLQRANARLARMPKVTQRRVMLLRANMLQLPLTRRFPLIVCAFNTLQHIYDNEAVVALLQGVRRRLAPGGCFAFDVLMPDLGWLNRDPRRRWARTRFTHPTTGAQLIYTTNHTYDPISQVALINIFYEPAADDNKAPPRVVRLAHRQFFPQELCMLVRASGLHVAATFGGFSGEPLDEDAESQVLLCCRPGDVQAISERIANGL